MVRKLLIHNRVVYYYGTRLWDGKWLLTWESGSEQGECGIYDSLDEVEAAAHRYASY